MNPETVKDIGSTAVGGAGGYGLLLNVKWELIPQGECVKVAVAVLLILLAYHAYRDKPPRNGAAA